MIPRRVTGTSKRGSFPIAVAHSANYVSPRAVLVGDAAHRIHPMAGQGVNLGFADVFSLTRRLSNAVQQGADVGATSHLYPYETERQRRNVLKLMGIDALYRLYRAQFLPVALARAVGLNLTDTMGPVKSWIIDQASR
jgi:2-polyprenyl-6-methoxyphenol hydroxylase-like FAD-dependent oxidoreductase